MFVCQKSLRVCVLAFVAPSVSAASDESFNERSFTVRSGNVSCQVGAESDNTNAQTRIELFGELEADSSGDFEPSFGTRIVFPLGRDKLSRGVDPVHCENLARGAAERQRIENIKEAVEVELLQIKLEERRLALQETRQRMENGEGSWDDNW